MIRAFAVFLALGLAAPARGEGAAPAPLAADLPGKSVELKVGDPAPFAGNLCDKECWAAALAKRKAAADAASAFKLEAQDARVRQAQAEKERDGRPDWGAVFAAGGGGLVVGLGAAIAIFYFAKK